MYRVGGRGNKSEAKRAGRIAVSATTSNMQMRGMTPRPTLGYGYKKRKLWRARLWDSDWIEQLKILK